ncbi:cobaltochelatase subunit CobT [Magnetovibrio sp. PR-2]|uniref:cobaltochelatase subunit CobT n=1 Tax=Magnetovibrio sp. PR-2 TaxID=3120356 RepID=UPI002FCDF203
MSDAEPRNETLKRATAATLKAMSQKRDMLVQFVRGQSAPAFHGGLASLPEPEQGPQLKARDIQRLRGEADALAMRLNYHDQKLHAQLSPAGDDARKVFNALEQARVEAVGIRDFPGAGQNLSHLHSQTASAFEDGTPRDNAQMAEALALLARQRFSDEPIPPQSLLMAEQWRPWLEDKAPGHLDKLSDAIGDQAQFAHQAGLLMKALELLHQLPSETEFDDSSNQDQTPNEQDEQPQPDEQSQPEDQDDQDADGAVGAESAGAEMSDGLDGGDGLDEDMMTGGETPAGPGEQDDNWPMNEYGRSVPYKAYTAHYDEVIQAEDLSDTSELIRLRDQLDRQLDKLQGVVSKLANRLQRRLLAKQTRSWEFDLEEGMLDAARLSRVVIDPYAPLSFKEEKDADFRDTVVTLLIDNSGSMRGRPITIAATSADVMARTLERCGVKVEILGFTTKAWKGGKSRELWVENDKPEKPGRLNDLRHIVYKGADAPWRRARRNLGLMLKEGILKENIDGEALLWAHERLLARPEQRRILMVISDGAPVDDATLSANAGNYLEKHLRDTIEWIETKSTVELVAIGIGHDVTRYYRRAVTLLDAEDLGGTIMAELADLFDEDSPQSHKRMTGRRRAS